MIGVVRSPCARAPNRCADLRTEAAVLVLHDDSWWSARVRKLHRGRVKIEINMMGSLVRSDVPESEVAIRLDPDQHAPPAPGSTVLTAENYELFDDNAEFDPVLMSNMLGWRRGRVLAFRDGDVDVKVRAGGRRGADGAAEPVSSDRSRIGGAVSNPRHQRPQQARVLKIFWRAGLHRAPGTWGVSTGTLAAAEPFMRRIDIHSWTTSHMVTETVKLANGGTTHVQRQKTNYHSVGARVEHAPDTIELSTP